MSIYANKVITIFDKKTSMRLTKMEWNILENICFRERMKRKQLFEMIDRHRNRGIGFTAAVRLFALLYLSAVADKVMNGYFPSASTSLEVNRVLNSISNPFDEDCQRSI